MLNFFSVYIFTIIGMFLLYKMICFIEKILSQTKYKRSLIIDVTHISFLPIIISSIIGVK